MKLDSKMRDEWAASHGLKRSSRDYWTAILGRRWNYDDLMRVARSWDDHGEVWNHDGRAVCYTSHPYDEPDRAELDALGVRYEVHPPPASWYYPGATWLVVLWSASAAGGAGARPVSVD